MAQRQIALGAFVSVRRVVVGAALVGVLAAWKPAWSQQGPQSPPVVQADPTGRWLRAESAHFVVYSERNEVRLRRYVEMLEDFDGVLRVLHGQTKAETPRKLPLYLIENNRALQRVMPGSPESRQGVYVRPLEDIFALAVRADDSKEDKNNGDDVVLHEYVHHFMMQYFPDSYPGWLTEGLAEYYMTIDLQPKRVQIGDYNRSRAYALLEGEWIPVTTLLSKRGNQLPREQVSAFYAQSWLLTHYIVSDKERKAKLDGYLELVRQHGDPVASWTKIYGQDAPALEKALKDYVKQNKLAGRVLTRPEPPAPEMTITRLPAGADDLLLEVQRLKLNVPKAEAPELLERVRRLAAKRPNEYYSRLALARAECKIGDRDQGEALLKSLLQERPTDLETLQVLAYSRLDTARQLARDPDQRAKAKAVYADAATYLGRAHKVDPDNYLTLYGYAEARSLDNEPTENTLNVAHRAASIAPQNFGIRVNAARLFIRARRYELARELLIPVAGDPHGRGLARQATQMLARMDGKVDGEPLGASAADAATPGQTAGEGDKDASGG